MSSSAGDTSTGQSRLEPLWWPLAGALLLLATYVWVFRDFLETQVMRAWRYQADWGHTLVIPLIAVYIVWLNRDKIRATPFKTTWWALVGVIGGMAWYSLTLLNDAIRNHNLQAVGAWVTLCSLLILFVGLRGMRYLWFPLIYLFIFGQSTSDRAITAVTYELQDIAARGSYFVLLLLGLDVERTGNTLFIYGDNGPVPLNIAEACSGMRMLMAFMALGVFLAYTGLQRTWQRVALVLAGIPTAIAVNVMRVVTLGLLGLWDTGFAAGDFHSFIGLLWLFPALVIYLGVMWMIRQIMVDRPDARAAKTAAPTKPAETTDPDESAKAEAVGP